MRELEALRDTLRGLGEPGLLLERLFVSLPVALQVVDRDGYPVFSNAAHTRLFGTVPPPTYSVLDDANLAAAGLLPQVRKAFAGETVQLPTLWYDPRALPDIPSLWLDREGLSHRRSDSRAVAIDLVLLPLADAAGDTAFVALLCHDVTARVAREAEQERSARVQARLLAVLGHELRTPLAAILTASARLLRKPELPEAIRPGIERIDHAGWRIGAILRRLQETARLRLGAAAPLQPRQTDLSALAARVADEIATVHDREIQLRIEGGVEGEWDPGPLAQAIANLLENAVVHGTGDVPVELRVHARIGWAEVEVTNGGTLPGPVLAALRAPPLADTGPRDALGIGLSLTREIALHHGGTLQGGAADGLVRFVLRLPA